MIAVKNNKIKSINSSSKVDKINKILAKSKTHQKICKNLTFRTIYLPKLQNW